MKPICLAMQAFASYGKKVTIDFTRTNQNLFLITGDTGSGKTTIFDAIVFALYGEASSNRNKKSGTELQSQYVDLSVCPYVELEFSEQAGGTEAHYTVHRVPRHKRNKERGTGEILQQERVSLMLPDGTEFSQNIGETNRKIQEIIGLDKQQFMQVAMIAQGEFVEVLRANSNEKKKIFRQLFDTEIYDKIVQEFAVRNSTMEKEMGEIQTAYRTELAHMMIPEQCENREEMLAVRHRILTDKVINSVDMELMLDYLQKLSSLQTVQLNEENEKRKAAEMLRDRKRDQYTEGQNLQKAFSQLEQYQNELLECESEETEIAAKELLASRISAAYSIRPVYHRMEDVRKALKHAEENLLEQQKRLPELESRTEMLQQEEKKAQTEKESRLQAYTAVSERVDQSIKVLKQIVNEEKKQADFLSDQKAAESKFNMAAKAVSEFEQQVQEAQARGDLLKNAGVELEQWNSRLQEIQNLQEQVRQLRALQAEYQSQQAIVFDAQRTYSEKRSICQKQSSLYERARNKFLDAQAGFLAKERLTEGEPCPVCGSVHHPNPQKLSKEAEQFTREYVDALADQVTESQKEQQNAAADAKSAADLLQEKEKNFTAGFKLLSAQLMKLFPECKTYDSLQSAETALACRQAELEQEGNILQKNAEERDKITCFLSAESRTREQLQKQKEDAFTVCNRLQLSIKTCSATLESYIQQRDYPSIQEAEGALHTAKELRDQSKNQYEDAHDRLFQCAEVLHETRTLILQFQEQVPKLTQQLMQREEEYREILAGKELTQDQWQQTVLEHEEKEAELLRTEVTEHINRKSIASGGLSAAKKTIGNQGKPDLDLLLDEKKAAEQQLLQVQICFEALKEQSRANCSTYGALAPRMNTYRKKTAEYSQLRSLFRRLDGQNKDAKMDIETYVQRYYLQRILYAANLRFQDMSAGQYELRMTDEEQAGKGKNHGLDLMVYSTITGKEREISTLSGGESFMAALSMALGMADQIQQNSAAVHLDMMFIDEGFGSLDSMAREQAVKVLQQMAGGTKLIGIISHVSELKQAIDDQLVITKEKDGSHPHWELS